MGGGLTQPRDLIRFSNHPSKKSSSVFMGARKGSHKSSTFSPWLERIGPVSFKAALDALIMSGSDLCNVLATPGDIEGCWVPKGSSSSAIMEAHRSANHTWFLVSEP